MGNTVLDAQAAGDDDPLDEPTGSLRDRHALFADLPSAVAPGAPQRLFVIFALDGLTAYGERYGRPAVQEVLPRLAGRLASTLDGAGTCYQPREGEFVALIDAAPAGVARLVEGCIDALLEPDAQAPIRASFGAALIPDEARETSEVLKLADQRLCRTRRDVRYVHEAAPGAGRPVPFSAGLIPTA